MLPATWRRTLRSAYSSFVLVPFPPSAYSLCSHPRPSENHLLPANLENGPRLPSTSGRARPRPPVLSLSTSIRVPSSLHILLQHGFQNSQYVTLSRLLFTTAAREGSVCHHGEWEGAVDPCSTSSSLRAILWPFVLATPRVACTFEIGLEYITVLYRKSGARGALSLGQSRRPSHATLWRLNCNGLSNTGSPRPSSPPQLRAADGVMIA